MEIERERRMEEERHLLLRHHEEPAHPPLVVLDSDPEAEDEDEEFEFAHAAGGEAVDLVYPVFGRGLGGDSSPATAVSSLPLERLAIDDGEAAASSDAGDRRHEAVQPHTGWAPRKSASIGTVERRSELKDLLMVSKSHSDGKDKFVHLNRIPYPNKTNLAKPTGDEAASRRGKGGKVTTVDVVTAQHRVTANGNGNGNGNGKKGGRRSFLPYRPELFFGNGSPHHGF